MFNMTNAWTDFWAVDLPYKADANETSAQRRERRDRDRAILAGHGIKLDRDARFTYRNTDKKGGVAAKAKAEKRAAEVTAKTGVVVEVVNGSYL